MTASSARPGRLATAPSAGGPLLGVAVLLVALNLRGPIVAVAPVVDAIRADLRVPAAVAGLLTTLPVLAFAVAAPPASWMITLSITVPLADGVGWRIALLAWSVVALAAVVVWIVATRGRRPGAGAVVTDTADDDWLALPGGLLLAPGAWPLWCSLGGAAQDGGFFVFSSAVLAASRTTTENRRLGAFMQTGGYAVGALGPTVVGALHGSGADPTAAWASALILVPGVLVVLATTGWAAARPR